MIYVFYEYFSTDNKITQSGSIQLRHSEASICFLFSLLSREYQRLNTELAVSPVLREIIIEDISKKTMVFLDGHMPPRGKHLTSLCVMMKTRLTLVLTVSGHLVRHPMYLAQALHDTSPPSVNIRLPTFDESFHQFFEAQ